MCKYKQGTLPCSGQKEAMNSNLSLPRAMLPGTSSAGSQSQRDVRKGNGAAPTRAISLPLMSRKDSSEYEETSSSTQSGGDVETGNGPGPSREAEVEDTHHVDSSKVITMVRQQLRLDESQFTPQCVPIGPYHASSSKWKQEKAEAVEKVVALGVDITSLKEDMRKLSAMECYASPLANTTTDTEFSSMMLEDGCYVLLCLVDYETKKESSDRADIEGSRRMLLSRGRGSSNGRNMTNLRAGSGNSNTVVRDIVFLLENQIPLLVLQKIDERINIGDSSSFEAEIAKPLQAVLQQYLFIGKVVRPPPPPTTSAHLLDLVQFYLWPQILQPGGLQRNPAASCHGRPMGRWRRAKEYCRYANVRFKLLDLKDGERWSFLDVRLKRGSVWTMWIPGPRVDSVSIPRLRVDSSTWTILRNLMALEEQRRKKPVTAYCVFMSQLACTVEDVELLQRAGILEQFLGSDERAAKGFADLCNGVVLDIDDGDHNYLKDIWHQLEKRSNSWAQTSKGFFRDKYCSNALLPFAFLIALIIFFCQFLQMLYGVLAYYRKK